MLNDLRILVVEDEAILAVDLSLTLEDEGAIVAGPCLTLEDAMALGVDVDAAVLDVDLCGRPVFPMADRLRRAGTPFVFHTGRADLEELRARYGDAVPIVLKPSAPRDILRGLSLAMGTHH